MDQETLLEEQIERESTYLARQPIGSEEYIASMQRLDTLHDKLIEVRKIKDEKKDRIKKNVLEGVKIGVSAGLPIFGLVVITAQERDITYTSALKGLISCFIPGKIK